MSLSTSPGPKVTPAQLSFLAIYNPTLRTSDENESDQIVYCFSRNEQKRRDSRNTAQRDAGRTTRQAGEGSHGEENERLRQIGLAQGMVEFAKNFSNGAPVESVETDKSRIILHELESDWWILASIDLTRLPADKTSGQVNSKKESDYSSREVAPAQLLLQQLQQAHSVFLLHHASSLADLWQRVSRDRFCGFLEKYWKKFVRDWDVLLHGNPAVDTLGAMKLSGGGELGIGVGEEEYGSGEREVLEGFVARTDGLVDLMVGRYDDPPAEAPKEGKAQRWLGRGDDARASDGIIFSGIGGLSKESRTTVSLWMHEIFKHGVSAYGVKDNPNARPRQRRDRESKQKVPQTREAESPVKSPRGRVPDLRRKAMENSAAPPGIPPPLIGAVERSLEQATQKVKSREASRSPRQEKSQDEAMTPTSPAEKSMFDTDKMMKILTLGYGTSWTVNPKGLPPEEPEIKTHIPQNDSPMQVLDPTPDVSDEEMSFVQQLEQSIGRFLIGLSGDLENTEFEAEDESDDADSGGRLVLRTVYVRMSKLRRPSLAAQGSVSSKRSVTAGCQDIKTSAAASVDGPSPINDLEKLQVALYVHQPFMFMFLFELRTPSLTMPSFYRNIHHQFGPLQKSLLRSTDPARVAERVARYMGEESSIGSTGKAEEIIYDLIHDPIKQTVRTSIPNIPVPGSLAAEGLQPRAPRITVSGSWYTLGIPVGNTSPRPEQSLHGKWTRAEALNVHTQILSMRSGARMGAERERTVKTGRGWWILWMSVANKTGIPRHKEAYLVRKSVDEKGPSSSKETRSADTGRWLLREQRRDSGGQGNGHGPVTGDGRSKGSKAVADGLGVDARKWIEGLMHLSQ